MSAPSFDPEAEQEVDFGRYVRLLAARWWLLAAGLVVGAVIGYAISLGGSQTFKATATLYLGQPYSASGNVQLQAAQTNPSTVRQIAHAEIVVRQVAAQCKAKPGDLRGGISTQTVSGNIAKNGQTPLVSITVQAKKRRLAVVRRERARARGDRRASPRSRTRRSTTSARRSRTTQRKINAINAALESGALVDRQARRSSSALATREDAQAQHEPAPAPGEAGREAVDPHRRRGAEGDRAQPAQHASSSPR